VPNTSRMGWPYPSEHQDPWFQSFEDLVTAIDSSGYAAREDRNIVFGSAAIWSFTAGTGVLSWDADLKIYSTIKGYFFTVPAGSVSLQEGELFYVDLVRAPSAGQALTPVVSSQVPTSDTRLVIGVRSGSSVFFRFGKKIGDGESFNVFEGGAGGGPLSDTFERESTFSIPDGSSTTVESTVGRVIYPGSLIGLSLEITEPVNSGTIDVTVRRNGVATLTTQLNTTYPSSRQITAPSGTWAVVADDALTVEVVPAAYDNLSGLDGGLTVNLAMLVGIDVEPSSIPDASLAQKGLTKLSVAPVLATNPISVGDNDPRVDTWDKTGAIVHLLTSTDDVRIGADPANPPASSYDLLLARAAGPSLVLKTDEVSGTETQIRSGLSTDPVQAGWVGAVSNHPLILFANNTAQWVIDPATDELIADHNDQALVASHLDFSQEPGGGGTNNNYIEGGAGSAVAVSPANKGRIRYNQSTQRFEVSENGAGYVPMVPALQSTLSDGAGIVVDGDVSYNFDLKLTQNSDLANPTNVGAGYVINIAVRQDAMGGWTLGFGSAYLFPGGTPTITAAANAEDMISCYVRAEVAGTATVMLCSITQNHS